MRNHVRFDKETGKFYQGKVKRSLKNGWYKIYLLIAPLAEGQGE
jgi:hypothetical protein